VVFIQENIKKKINSGGGGHEGRQVPKGGVFENWRKGRKQWELMNPIKYKSVTQQKCKEQDRGSRMGIKRKKGE